MSSSHAALEIPDAVTFEPGNGEFERACLTHRSGARCELYPYGGHVTSWTSSAGRELLFLSERAEFRRGKAIRGGIPIIFPQFSGQGPLPAHGFARNTIWKVESTNLSPENDVGITLSLSPSDPSRAIWPHDFLATLTVVLNERLTLTMSLENRGSESFQFQNAFHSYFRVSDIARTAIEGLRGVAFTDFLQGGKIETETRERVSIAEATDRAYTDAPDTLRIVDDAARSAFRIRKTGMKDAVVWNPWKEKCAALQDMLPSEYLRMLCVETGNVGTRVTLAPGAAWVAVMELAHDVGAA